MKKDPTYFIMDWICLKSADIFTELAECDPNDIEQNYKRNKLIGAYNILRELKDHILIETNPHNREDIEKIKANRAKANENL